MRSFRRERRDLRRRQAGTGIGLAILLCLIVWALMVSAHRHSWDSTTPDDSFAAAGVTGDTEGTHDDSTPPGSGRRPIQIESNALSPFYTAQGTAQLVGLEYESEHGRRELDAVELVAGILRDQPDTSPDRGSFLGGDPGWLPLRGFGAGGAFGGGSGGSGGGSSAGGPSVADNSHGEVNAGGEADAGIESPGSGSSHDSSNGSGNGPDGNADGPGGDSSVAPDDGGNAGDPGAPPSDGSSIVPDPDGPPSDLGGDPGGDKGGDKGGDPGGDDGGDPGGDPGKDPGPDPSPTPVPEPTTLVALGSGLVLMARTLKGRRSS
jgi:hypothetical protein